MNTATNLNVVLHYAAWIHPGFANLFMVFALYTHARMRMHTRTRTRTQSAPKAAVVVHHVTLCMLPYACNTDLNAFMCKSALGFVGEQHIGKLGVRVLAALVPVCQEACRIWVHMTRPVHDGGQIDYSAGG